MATTDQESDEDTAIERIERIRNERREAKDRVESAFGDAKEAERVVESTKESVDTAFKELEKVQGDLRSLFDASSAGSSSGLLDEAVEELLATSDILGGEMLDDVDRLHEMLAEMDTGDTVDAEVVRDGQRIGVTVEVLDDDSDGVEVVSGDGGDFGFGEWVKDILDNTKVDAEELVTETRVLEGNLAEILGGREPSRNEALTIIDYCAGEDVVLRSEAADVRSRYE